MLKLMKNKMPTLIAYTLSSRTRQTFKPKLAKKYAIENSDFADTKKPNFLSKSKI